MICSMTGFGKAVKIDEKYRISVEIKAINHRYSDINIKLPRILNTYDAALRSLIKEYVERGKLDVYITFEDHAEETSRLFYNKTLAEEYLKILRQMQSDFNLDMDIRVSSLSRMPEVLVMEEADPEDPLILTLLMDATREALEELKKTRSLEGGKLKNDLLEKLSNMETFVAEIEKRAPGILEEYKNRIREKVAELKSIHDVDENRLATEITLFADKICIDEELVRLKSHITGMKDILTNGEAVGRKLDFLAQEMNREANTVLSKSTDPLIADIGINLKTEIEKIREQVQNIE